MAIELFPHNQNTYTNILNMFETDTRVGVVQPTGTGKSFLYLKWMEDHPDDTFTILSPSNEIFTQLREYAAASGNEDMLSFVRMISYQSLLKMSDEQIQWTKSSKIVLDEFHRTGAEQWGPALQKLLDANPRAQVLGASATPVRYLDDAKDMALELFDRNLAVEMTLGEAVRRGILPTPKYVPVWYDIDGKLEQYERDISRIKNKDERKELEEKLELMKRRLQNSYGAEDIFKKNMPHNHGKFIVFCADREHLDEMKQTVSQWLSDVNSNVRKYVSISAETDKDLQLQAFKDDNGEDAVKLLFTIDRLNEGIHVKGIDGVIMLRPTVSPIIYLQQMGRALASGGETPLIFDMVNNYQNVQVPMADGGTRNVFEYEFRDGVGRDVEVGDFRIFEDMIEFNSLFDKLEDSLYLSYEEIWERNFALLENFLNEYNRFPLSREEYCGVKLGDWCVRQRKNFNNGSLSYERIQKMQSTGFVFDNIHPEWQYKYNLYIDYKKKFCCEPISSTVYQGEKLGKWCFKQRIAFKNGDLSCERIQMLQSAGFVFNFHEYEWQRKFDLYVSYVKEHGKDPSNEVVYRGENIGVWCHTQRRAFNDNKLSYERIQKLRSVGFIFEHFDLEWQRKFDLYVAYKQEFCREPLGSTVYQGENIGVWCHIQRKSLNKGTLSYERTQKLCSVGFAFNLREYEWQRKFDLYVAYKKEFYREPLVLDVYRGEKIGAWCRTQKSSFKNGSLSKEKIQKLQSAGFPFDNLKQDKTPLDDLIAAAEDKSGFKEQNDRDKHKEADEVGGR